MTFIDTAYFVALSMKRDALHGCAIRWSKQLSGPFMTTEFVLCEYLNYMSRPKHRAAGHALLAGVINNQAIQIVEASTDLIEEAVTLHRERPDKSWSLTDCTSFVTMKQYQLTDALTSDEHFEQAGFRALMRNQ